MEIPTARSRWQRFEQWLASPWLWVACLALGVAVRFRQFLFAASYWYDESFILLTVRQNSLGELLGPQPYNVVGPPIFLWITRLLHEVGGGECWMRLPAFVAGLAALFLMVPLARRVAGPSHGIWAVLALAVSGHANAHGCEVHFYTFDLLATMLLLTFTVQLFEDVRSRSGWLGLLIMAVVAPWSSLPAVFVLGGVSITLLIRLWANGTRGTWSLWALFNLLVAASGFALWWLSYRHFYYTGMMEHWGHRGWGGFPDWDSATATVKWLLTRPVAVGNYGNREMGFIWTALAGVGLYSLARRDRAWPILFAGPFLLAVGAALLGRFPIAHRTTLFLYPCVLLPAAAGVQALFAVGRDWVTRAALAALLALGVDAAWTVITLVRPVPGVDYRGAYVQVERLRQPGDALWAQMAVVYQTYYGLDADVLSDHQIDEAVEHAKTRRTWYVAGDTRHDLRQRFESAAGRMTFRAVINGLEVALFEPPGDHGREAP